MQIYRKNAYKSMRSGHGPRLKVRMSELSKVIHGQKSVEELTGMLCCILVCNTVFIKECDKFIIIYFICFLHVITNFLLGMLLLL